MSVAPRQPSIRNMFNCRDLLRLLWYQNRLSRWEMHEQARLSPNAVGTLVDAMLLAGFIRECAPEPASLGRPRVPLELDPQTRHVLGLALVPGHVILTRLGLTGDVLGKPLSRKVFDSSELVSTAAELLGEHLNPRTLAVGVTVTGYLEPNRKSILLSSALPGHTEESLLPVFQAAGDTIALLQNDSHALAARWFLTHRAEHSEDVLLVSFEDGRFGAALLIKGRPNRGCMTGGNELGHTRFPGIETERCFCGQVGCLERIVSSEFLHRQDRKFDRNSQKSTLRDRIIDFTSPSQDPGLDTVLHLLAHSLANAINLLRLHRLVIVSPYPDDSLFNSALVKQIRLLALTELAQRTKIDLWRQPTADSAENAGYLVLAELMYGEWDALDQGPQTMLPLSSSRLSIIS